MTEIIDKIKHISTDLTSTKAFFYENYQKFQTVVRIYTHLDADGLTAGAILGKALYREEIPFQITILRQLEKEEILKIANLLKQEEGLLIFCDFGSGQYLELCDKLKTNGLHTPFIILDHHLPQKIADKEDPSIQSIYQKTTPWHINPYFYDINGSLEISGAGLCYLFAKTLNENNMDLSSTALVGATGDIQNQGPNDSFIGVNTYILDDATKSNLVEIVNDLNFSSIKPLNEALAYSSDIELPGLTGNTSKTLKFLKTLGILMEKPDGKIKTLNDLSKDEKQKISSAIIEYSSVKLDIEPAEIIKKLIVNRYILKNEVVGSKLHDFKEFSNLLNSCGRSENGSLGIAIAMGDRKIAYEEAQSHLINYKKSIAKALSWVKSEKKLQSKDYIHFFYGENVISENIIGVIASILIFDKSGTIDKSKPIFGCVRRKDEDVYKISGRADENIVRKGVNLSEAIRLALVETNLDALGGGHPPAAGTKVPLDKIDEFLTNLNVAVKHQLDK